MTRLALQVGMLSLLEGVFHKTIKLDRSRGAELKKISECTFLIDITERNLSIYLVIDSTGHLRLQTKYDGEITTRISGTTSDFVALILSDDPGSELVNSPLEIHGDSNRLLELNNILRNMDLDWESPLTEYLGDVVGHQLANLVRNVNRWKVLTQKSLSRQVKEYVHEEARLSPSALELEDFYQDMQQFTLALDRIAFQVDRLQKTFLTPTE